MVLSACEAGTPQKTRAQAVYVAASEAYSQERYAEALEYLGESLRLDRNFYQARLLEGKVLFFQNRTEEAGKIFAALAAARPEYTEARLWNLRCLVISASSPSAGGGPEEARKALDRELSLNPGDWRVLYLYAVLAGNSGDWEKRLSMGRRAEAALSDSARVYLDLAMTWHSLGLEDRAGLFLEKARLVSGQNLSLARLGELTEEFFASPQSGGPGSPGGVVDRVLDSGGAFGGAEREGPRGD
jgi:tetratricopeptide (TPR) repeat protein